MDNRDEELDDEIQTCRKLDFSSDIALDTGVEDEGNEDKVAESEAVVKSNEKVRSIHSRIRKELIPVFNMEFETEEEAFNFYKTYAYNFGFSIRRSKFHKDKCGNLRDRLFVCSSEGKRENNNRDDFVKHHRAETRFGCLARMKIKCQLTGKYRVVEFVPEHTHVTSSPCKTHLFRSHRNMTLAQIAEADMADGSGIAPKATLEFLSRQAGGRQNLGFIPDDYRNYLRSKRTREMKFGDTGGVLEYLQRMQLEDPNFIHAIQVDEDDLITNIFWADGKMTVDYAYFGDVVCFDTTYRKNKDGRPFAMFVGVNNHKQTIIFGAALLYDETAETFMWLFDTFVKAMSGKKPKSILTDQDAAMAKALASQWPQTCHRLCIWHIYQNAAKHLSSVFDKFKDFTKDFSSCIYDYDEEEDFLNAWSMMLEKYDLKGNDWLKRLFDQKEKWALVYGRETFCADITTTQCSESMNSSLKNYVSYKHDLLRFFHHFERLLEDRRYEELKADFKASQSSPALSFPVEILKHAASVYTPKVFKMFQNELCKAHDCTLDFAGRDGTVTKFEITPQWKHFHHIVTFDSEDNSVLCSCKKFEFAGILCAHALKVLSLRSVKSIPTQYILERWTKNIKVSSAKVTCDITNENGPKEKIVRRYKELCRLHTQLATRAAESEKAYKIAISSLNNTLEAVDACLREESNEHDTQVIPQVISGVTELNECVCIDGNKVRGIKTKARVKATSSRPKSALEKLTHRKKPRKKVSRPSDNDSIRVLETENVSAQTREQSISLGASQFSQLLDAYSMNFPVELNVMPPPLQSPQFMQAHNLGAYNGSYQLSSTSMVNLLQAQVPLGVSQSQGVPGGLGLVSSELSSTNEIHDAEMQNGE